MGWVRGWVIHCAYECPHKDRGTKVCVCVYMHVCVCACTGESDFL